jgi:hypothetical protein
MKPLIDLPVRIVGALAIALIVATCKGDAGPAGMTGPTGAMGTAGAPGAQGATGPAGVVWKGVSFSFVTPGVVGSTVNVATLTFTAPSAGFVWVEASGYCNVTQGSAAAHGSLGWTTTSAGLPTIPNSAYILTAPLSEASALTQIPYGTSGVFSVASGASSLYLTLHNWSAGVNDCSGTGILMFSSSLLPLSSTNAGALSTGGVRVP